MIDAFRKEGTFCTQLSAILLLLRWLRGQTLFPYAEARAEAIQFRDALWEIGVVANINDSARGEIDARDETKELFSRHDPSFESAMDSRGHSFHGVEHAGLALVAAEDEAHLACDVLGHGFEGEVRVSACLLERRSDKKVLTTDRRGCPYCGARRAADRERQS